MQPYSADMASKPHIIITIRSDGEKVDDGTAALKNNANSAKEGRDSPKRGCGGRRTLSREDRYAEKLVKFSLPTIHGAREME